MAIGQNPLNRAGRRAGSPKGKPMNGVSLRGFYGRRIFRKALAKLPRFGV